MRTMDRAGESRGRTRRYLALGGLVATCPLTAAFALLHVLWYRFPFPPEAIAQSAVGVTSGAIDSFFIDRLGHWAQHLAVIGLSTAFALSGAVLAQGLPAGWRDRPLAWALVPAPLWAVTVALYSAPEPFLHRTELALASLPIFLLDGLLGWRYLVVRPHGMPTAGDPRAMPGAAMPRGPAVSRRSLLAALGAGGLGVALGSSGIATYLAGGSDTGATPLRVAKVVKASVPAPAPGDAAFAHIAGLTPEVTSNADFYVVDKDILNPVLDPGTWRLRIRGLVERPLSLSYAALRSMQAFERYQTLECISNKVGGHLMSTALWTGVPLRSLLEMTGVRAQVRTVVFRSASGYSESLPLAKAMDPTTLVAIGMNGRELPRAHGFPARLLTVGTYGMKNPKWLTEIELIDGDYQGYWEVRGWAPDVDPKTTTRIDVPESGSTVTSPSVAIAGVAFAGDRGISRVEVSLDAGRTWQEALLKTALSPYAWRLWRFDWRPTEPGTYRILARAVDGAGQLQSATATPPFPSGAAGLEGITVTVA